MSVLRAMFIDDEPNILSGLRRMLRGQRGEWEMVFANSGPEGLALMDAQPVDVLVCDMRMPGMDGVAVMAAVRERFPSTARIILTGQTDRESVIAALGLTQRFLLKPCRPEDLVAAIEQVVEVRRAVSEGQIQAFLGSVHALPRPPAVYTRIVEVSSRPDCEVADLVEVIEGDIATATEVLKLVNSGVFCTPHPVDTLDGAVVLLGFDAIQALALASSALRSEVPVPVSFDLDAVAHYSTVVAAMCRRIAAGEGGDRGGVSAAFLSGLLHTVGLLVQIGANPAGWERVREASVDPWSQAAAEREAFACTSTQASAYLLGLWGFAEPIVHTVLEQPVCPEDLLATPAACALTYARVRVGWPGAALPEDSGGYLTAERAARWDEWCAELREDAVVWPPVRG
ncbi:HDOD domain-containing protein [Cryptosporangium sp. NPDC051539]|uniref:HDOD domain-containing protein n=1 Tax=Cryptosporangium sp. NPDC051539 TaxID=3363962 RepID=UPI0037A36F7A